MKKHLSLDDLNVLLHESELAYVASLIGVPYPTLYNYRVGRSRLETIPYVLVDKLSTLAMCHPNAPNLQITKITHPVKETLHYMEVTA